MLHDGWEEETFTDGTASIPNAYSDDNAILVSVHLGWDAEGPSLSVGGFMRRESLL